MKMDTVDSEDAVRETIEPRYKVEDLVDTGATERSRFLYFHRDLVPGNYKWGGRYYDCCKKSCDQEMSYVGGYVEDWSSCFKTYEDGSYRFGDYLSEDRLLFHFWRSPSRYYCLDHILGFAKNRPLIHYKSEIHLIRYTLAYNFRTEWLALLMLRRDWDSIPGWLRERVPKPLYMR